jgi:hypothetical protein
LGGKREQQSSWKTNTIPADRYLLARETETAIIADELSLMSRPNDNFWGGKRKRPLARETETAIIAKTDPNPADLRFLARGEILRRKE